MGLDEPYFGNNKKKKIAVYYHSKMHIPIHADWHPQATKKKRKKNIKLTTPPTLALGLSKLQM